MLSLNYSISPEYCGVSRADVIQKREERGSKKKTNQKTNWKQIQRHFKVKHLSNWTLT